MAVKNKKICPNCASRQTKKVGLEDAVQKYKCSSYNKKFRSKRRSLKLHKTMKLKIIDDCLVRDKKNNNLDLEIYY